MPFDLSKVDTRKASEEGAVLHLLDIKRRDPLYDDEGKPVTITLAGRDSARAKRADNASINRSLKAGSRRSNGITAEDLDENSLELLSHCTLAWSGFVDNGELLECNPKNARLLYETCPDFREQAAAFLDDRSNFLPK
jgi:hypothetical protein